MLTERSTLFHQELQRATNVAFFLTRFSEKTPERDSLFHAVVLQSLLSIDAQNSPIVEPEEPVEEGAANLRVYLDEDLTIPDPIVNAPVHESPEVEETIIPEDDTPAPIEIEQIILEAVDTDPTDAVEPDLEAEVIEEPETTPPETPDELPEPQPEPEEAGSNTKSVAAQANEPVAAQDAVEDEYTIFDVRDFGAIANDGVDDSQAIQAAIDAARDHDGDARVVLEGGKYLSDNALFVHDNTYLHIDESAALVKGYVSGAANAFIRTEPVTRGLNDLENNISNGLKLVDNVTITGGGRIELKSKALDGTGSYGPILLVAGSNWDVNNITIDGYYSTPDLDASGNLILSPRPEKEYKIEANGNAIGILVVGDNHVLTDLNILDGSHSYGTTGIRVFSGNDIYISNTYIESGDDMIATAPVAKYILRNGEYSINQSPLNQGDIDGVHFHNITGYSTAARAFAAIDGHAPKLGPVWGNKVTDVTITELDATVYKANHGLVIANYLGDEEITDPFGNVVSETGLLDRFSILDSTLTMENLPSGLVSFLPNGVDPYDHARGLVVQDVQDVIIDGLTITGDIGREAHYIGIDGAANVFEDDVTLEDTVIEGAELWLDDTGEGDWPWDTYLHTLFQSEGEPAASAEPLAAQTLSAPAWVASAEELGLSEVA